MHRYKISDSVICKKFGDEIVIARPDTGFVASGNKDMLEIIECISDSIYKEDLIIKILQMHNSDFKEKLTENISMLLASLEKNGLIDEVVEEKS